MNSADGRNLNSFYAYKNTFDSDSVWLDIPKNGKSLNECVPREMLIGVSSNVRQHS